MRSIQLLPVLAIAFFASNEVTIAAPVSIKEVAVFSAGAVITDRLLTAAQRKVSPLLPKAIQKWSDVDNSSNKIAIAVVSSALVGGAMAFHNARTEPRVEAIATGAQLEKSAVTEDEPALLSDIDDLRGKRLRAFERPAQTPANPETVRETAPEPTVQAAFEAAPEAALETVGDTVRHLVEEGAEESDEEDDQPAVRPDVSELRARRLRALQKGALATGQVSAGSSA